MKIRFFIIVVLIFSILVSGLLIGCNRDNKKESQSFDIVATFYPLYIMLMNITENIPELTLSLLAPADTGCLHDYQLTTKDMSLIQNCDVLVMNGGGMEHFMEDAISIKPSAQIINACGDWPLLDENPHIWVSTDGAAHQTLEIATQLSLIDPTNAEKYMANAKNYIEKIKSLTEEMNTLIAPITDTPIITFHEAFPYFAKQFNLNVIASVEQEHGSEPSPRQLTELINLIRQEQAMGRKPILFVEPGHTSSAAQIISDETGIPIKELDSATTGELDKDSYINTMLKNAHTLFNTGLKNKTRKIYLQNS